VTIDLFDMKLRALRRDRAARTGPELFLLDRAFDDCIERLSLIRRSFRSAILLGSPNPGWPDRLRAVCDRVDVIDPGALFASAARGKQADEHDLPIEPESCDLIVSIGTLETANGLPDALLRLRFALRPDGLLLGAVAGGDTLPKLRSAMRAADEAAGVATPHVHPRIDPPALTGLLSAAGFDMPVVDVDRVQVSYGSLRGLLRDLRGMAATNILSERSRKALSRPAFAAAERAFSQAGDGERTPESFEILHFAAWTPGPSGQPPGGHG